MKIKTILLLIFALTGQHLLAQVTSKSAQNDTLLRIMTRTLPAFDTLAVPELDRPLFFNQNLTFKLRLDSIQRTVPLSYNEYVQEYIDIYSKRPAQMGKMMGLSAYYFPIFENALKAYNIPVEIKYLPIIESSMDPHAISKVGATGIWQFMYGTAKAYGLTIDNFVDERKDPIQASYAAAAYFRDAYEELGDWLLAIAAYNCGKGNVTRAIAKAGSNNFWEIRKYLPKETRNYVPAFIATVYLMNYAQTHGISAKPSQFNFKTDTIQVTHFVALSDLAKVINHDEALLASLNPSFKKKIVNGTVISPKRLVLPNIDLNNYAAVYDLLNTDHQTNQQVILASTDDVRDLRKLAGKTKKAASAANYRYHQVAPGQNLSAIASKYNVEVQDLKVWNRLPANTIVPGQRLKIYSEGFEPKIVVPKVKSNFVNYIVRTGDTLSGIAEKFDGVTVSAIKKANGLSKATLQPGMVLKISKG